MHFFTSRLSARKPVVVGLGQDETFAFCSRNDGDRTKNKTQAVLVASFLALRLPSVAGKNRQEGQRPWRGENAEKGGYGKAGRAAPFCPLARLAGLGPPKEVLPTFRHPRTPPEKPKYWRRRGACFLWGQRDPPPGSATLLHTLASQCFLASGKPSGRQTGRPKHGRTKDQCYARSRQDRESHQTARTRQRESARGTRQSGSPDTGSGNEPYRNGSGPRGTGASRTRRTTLLHFLWQSSFDAVTLPEGE